MKRVSTETGTPYHYFIIINLDRCLWEACDVFLCPFILLIMNTKANFHPLGLQVIPLSLFVKALLFVAL